MAGPTEGYILAFKQRITSHNLFHKLLMEFHTFLEDCHSLEFHDKPNYNKYINLFNGLFLKKRFKGDQVFD